MIVGLALFNLALVLAVLVVPPWIRRGASKDAGTSASLNVVTLLRDAYSPDAMTSARALSVLAHHPDRCIPALPTALALTGEGATTLQSALAMALARGILQRWPDLLTVSWPAPLSNGRRAVVLSIQRPMSPGSSQIIVEATRDPDAAVRRAAAARLHLLEVPVARSVAESLLEDSDEDVRRYAYGLLGRYGLDDTVDVLIARLADATPAQVPPILDALADIGRRGYDRLETVAVTAPTVNYRVAAIRALGAAGLLSTSLLLARMLGDTQKEIRRAAAAGLADIARTAGRDVLPSQVAAALLAQLPHETSVSATLAMLDLAEILRPDNAGAVLGAAMDGFNPSVRERALEVLTLLEGARSARQ